MPRTGLGDSGRIRSRLSATLEGVVRQVELHRVLGNQVLRKPNLFLVVFLA
jgi:hypothetical protein